MKTFGNIAALGIFLFCLMIWFPEPVSARDAEGDLVIIVDAGHGGNDGGAVSVNGVKESDLNWQIALALKAELQTYSGVKVYLTRGSAEWQSNAGRGREGAVLGADLFISCHNNAGSSTASGVQVYGTVNANFKAAMQTLSTAIAAKVSSLGLANGGYFARGDDGNPSVDYYTMLDEATKVGIPSLIVEHCYLSNANDAAFIEQKENQLRCGAADATAIAEYYGLSKRGVNAGSSITLIRTYSAYIQGGTSGSYTSSNTGVASVRSDGLVTAVGQGSATVTGTSASGESFTVTIKVPAVTQVGLAAGITPTFYSDASTYNKNTIIVKAIYSDGSVSQVTSGFSVGQLPALVDQAYDIPISYNGFSTSLRIYNYYVDSSYDPNNYQVVGSNTDILMIPGIYDGITTGGTISTGGSSEPQTETTQAVTEAPTTVQPETTTEPETTTIAPIETTRETETTTIETTREEESDTTVQGEQNSSNSPWKWILSGTILVLAVGGFGTGFILYKRKT